MGSSVRSQHITTFWQTYSRQLRSLRRHCRERGLFWFGHIHDCDAGLTGGRERKDGGFWVHCTRNTATRENANDTNVPAIKNEERLYKQRGADRRCDCKSGAAEKKCPLATEHRHSQERTVCATAGVAIQSIQRRGLELQACWYI